jgi:cyclase
MEWKTELTEPAPGAFAYVQASGGMCISNAGFIPGKNGSTVVDALFVPSMARDFIAQFRRVAHTPVRRLVNTHHHVDHTAANFCFPDIDKIAHARAREVLVRWGFPAERLAPMVPHFAGEFGEIQLDPPNVVFEGDEMRIDDGQREIRLLHWGTAHTVGDVLVYLPEEKVLYAGDVAFFYVTPLAFEGHISRWIAALERILEMDVERIVPGHGPVGGKEDVRLVRDYFLLLKEAALHAYEEGMSEADVANSIDLGPYAGWEESERVVPNVMRLYQEFRETLDEPMDLTAMAAGMAAYRERRLSG